MSRVAAGEEKEDPAAVEVVDVDAGDENLEDDLDGDDEFDEDGDEDGDEMDGDDPYM